jgi:hypothetical protein
MRLVSAVDEAMEAPWWFTDSAHNVNVSLRCRRLYNEQAEAMVEGY